MNWLERYLAEGHTVAEVAAACGVALKTAYRWREGQLPRADRFGAIESMTGRKIQDLIPEVFDPTR